MKKRTAWLLVILLLTGAGAAIGEGTETMPVTRADRVEDSIGLQRGTELVVGSATEMSGYFATDLWGNNTSDMDVRLLLHGYSTVAQTRLQGMELDGTVVKGLQIKEESDGSREYTLSLTSDLCYNDGTRITAKDYVFSLLMCGSPVITELGGTPQGLGHIKGAAAYQAGLSKELAGVRLLSEDSFSISIRSEYKSYFYGLAMLNVTPYPMAVIAPGCDVFDDGNGAYIGASKDAAGVDSAAPGFTPGAFSAEMLRLTLLDPEMGYVFNPRVTSGPYALESYDEKAHVASFVINERFAGNYEGQKPHIERIVFKPVKNETMMAELASGEVDLLNKVTAPGAVAEGFALVRQQGQAQMGNYLRTGFAFLSFACEQGVTSSEAVRKAVASCIDKSVFVASAIGSTSALPVYGYYGLGQWMTAQTFQAEPEKGLGELSVMAELAGLETPYDLELAKRLLAEDGWTLNASGGLYEEGADDIRYRWEDGLLTPLVIRWAKTEDNPVADAIEQALEGPFQAIGMGLEITEMPFSEMMTHYYRQTDRSYDMFYLANNFGYVFDPYYDFNTGAAYQGSMNTTGLCDEELMRLAQDMRMTHPTEMRAYTEKWLVFQRYWVERMPMVPLYSNVYFDFFSNELANYNISQYTSWAHAIPYAFIGVPDALDGGALISDDDEIIIDDGM